MRKKLIGGATALSLAATGAGVAAAVSPAQEAPPTVGLAVSATSVQVTGAEALKAGPTTLRFTAAGKGELAPAVLELKPGVTREQVAAAAKDLGTMAGEKVGTLVASTFLMGPAPYTTTVDLDPGEHAVLNFGRKGATVAGWFTVGAERGTAVAPAPTTTVTMEDYAFGGPSTLPRGGTIRVTNAGKVQHHALVMPLKKGVSTKRVLKDIKAGKEPAYALGGPPSALTEVVSPGTTNDVTTTASKPGKYLLVCFLQNSPKQPPHAVQGMAKVVTVK
ncbi:MAG TPA: hypothetical protein VN238_03415 [Solirubrobacteraceae bacterium]|nr:hypothetical protein [Solirubrobacteraceae bacterium]